jgi:hypothetical protein
MSYVRFAMVLLVAGCRSIFGIHDPTIATDDADVDAASDGIDGSGCTSFSSLFDTCALPAGVPMPGSVTAYSSDSGSITNGANSVPVPHVTVATTLGSIDVVSLTSFVQDPDGMLRITGTLPVAFAVSGELEITGRVDLSAGGAGTGCDVNGTGGNGVVQLTAGDGGGGGGNVEIGGNGGGGDNHATLTHGGVAQPAGLHGGCAGGRGGEAASGVVGGLGGGAFYLVAASPIVIIGVIDASGGGGKGAGVPHGGGAGGGAGGLLMLEASGVDIAGQLDATGGGGGGGADALAPGVAGKLGSAGGNGGNGSSGNPGGHGGNGVISPTDGATGPSAAGGGGGGGAVGRITITSPGFVNAGSVAPPPS